MARKREKYSHIICGGTLIVIPELAMILGNMERAAILEQICYYTQVLAKNPDNNHEDDNGKNRVWAYNSYKEWQEHDFPCMSVRTVAETFRFLVDNGLLLTGNFNKKHPDHTLWYTIHPDINKNFDKLTEKIGYNTEKWQFIENRIIAAENRFNLEKDKLPKLFYHTLNDRLTKEEKQRKINEYEANGWVFDYERKVWTNPEDGTFWNSKAGEEGAWVKDEDASNFAKEDEMISEDATDGEIKKEVTKKVKDHVQIKSSDKETIDHFIWDESHTIEENVKELHDFIYNFPDGEYREALRAYTKNEGNKFENKQEELAKQAVNGKNRNQEAGDTDKGEDNMPDEHFGNDHQQIQTQQTDDYPF